MFEREQKVADEYQKAGYNYVRSGSPDFLFYKEKNGKITDYEFVEVKSPQSRLSKNQKIWQKILLDLNVNYRMIPVSLHGESAERGDSRPRCKYCEKQSLSRAGKFHISLKSIYIRDHKKREHWIKIGYWCPNCHRFYDLEGK